MSDFTSNFWSVFVAAITVGGILACLLLLWVTARKKVAADADNTTGHVWDEDLREMNNPLPRWWMWMFVLTIVFSLLYLVAYPGLGGNVGMLGEDYPGYFAPGDASALAHLLRLCRQTLADPHSQLAQLQRACEARATLFLPTREQATLLAVVNECLAAP